MPRTFAAQFRIKPGERAHLGRRDPADVSAFPDRDAAEAQTRKDAEAINDLQDRLYAEGKRALLVILQGIDTAGKDGTIRHVFERDRPARRARVTPSAGRARRSWRTISCGAPTSPARAAATSASSTARTTRTCWSAASASSRPRRRSRRATTRSTRFEKMLSENGTTHPEVHAAHLAGRSSASVCRSAWTSPRAAGSSIPTTSKTASSGTSTRRPTS